MTATISQVKAGLATRLATITGLRALAYQPDQLNPPLSFANLDSINYHRTMRTPLTEMQFTVSVIVARATERPAENALDAYTSADGPASVKAAIEADRTLGGIVDDLIVESCTGIQTITANDGDYLGIESLVRVYN